MIVLLLRVIRGLGTAPAGGAGGLGAGGPGAGAGGPGSGSQSPRQTSLLLFTKAATSVDNVLHAPRLRSGAISRCKLR
jgi:hypothetical protein